MEAKPLPKAIYDKAKELNIKTIKLAFSGGNDEGYLDVSLGDVSNKEFAQEVENWAWNNYRYSGAGDGNDYGDDIVYDLENNKVTTSDWYTEPKVINGTPSTGELEVGV